MHILVVEDDLDLANAMVHIQQRAGYGVDAVHTGEDGMLFAENDIYDAIIFDVMLPGIDGFHAVEDIRSKGIQTPVLMLTARGAVVDKIEGFDSGADSYMVKPFSPQELLARLRALTRRTAEKAPEALSAGDVTLDPTSRRLHRGDDDVQLSNKEFLLATLLFEHPHTTLTKKQIADAVWGPDADASDNNVEAYVSMLRKKLDFLDSHLSIKTERAIGYRLEGVSDDAS